ncbi:HAD domain-containing protein [Nocardia halotolerans]|uniref:HAD domain-containing protein n=1 Tax=Nocardia halotolerans TaxID=1755878 RepID=A0ABV8VC89_9NOCA
MPLVRNRSAGALPAMDRRAGLASLGSPDGCTAESPHVGEVERVMSKPLLYLDVDGVLNPWRAKPEKRPAGYETHRLTPAAWLAEYPSPPRRVKPLRVWLNPEHGPKLLALGEVFDLWWATTWEHDANTQIGPLIGLPELPVVEWRSTKRFGPDGVFWKTAELVEHAAGRPFVWVDDDITVRDRRYVEQHHPALALLHYVDPAKGLLDDDFDTLQAWGACQFGVAGSAA